MKQIFDVPDRGDVVRLSFPDRPGRTRAGRRLAVVLSPQPYNARIGLAIVCPIGADVRGYPFEVAIPGGLPFSGAILADQAESLDWRAHRAETAGSLSPDIVAEVLGKLGALLR
jgi:mRNA interferase MazF